MGCVNNADLKPYSHSRRKVKLAVRIMMLNGLIDTADIAVCITQIWVLIRTASSVSSCLCHSIYFKCNRERQFQSALNKIW